MLPTLRELTMSLFGDLFERRQLIDVVSAGQEGKPADHVPIRGEPRAHQKPLLFPDRNGDRRIVFGVVLFDEFPVTQLLERRDVVLEERTFGCGDGKVDDIGDRALHTLPHLGRERDPLIAEHFEEPVGRRDADAADVELRMARVHTGGDRKSTRLNSSHSSISYAVFCLKKNNTKLYPALHDPLYDNILAVAQTVVAG